MKSLPGGFAKRIGYSFLIGMVFGAVLSEISFISLKETARASQTITLTIPEGAAAQVAHGEQPPSIPQDMVFVVGDILLVKNEDSADHKLGPLWIPARSTAQMSLGEEQSIAMECSFQSTNYLDLDVRQSLTWSTRLYGMAFAGVPLSLLIAVYSFVVPSRKKEHAPA